MNPVAIIALIIIGGLWFACVSVFFVFSVMGIVGALRESALFDRQENHSASKSFCLTNNRRSAPKEYSMKNRIALVVLLACGLAATSLLSSCSTLDIPVEIQVVGTDNLGNQYDVTVGPDGVYGTITSVVGQELYTLSDDGFAVTLPDGKGGTVRVRIKRADQSAINNQQSALP